MKLNGGKNLLQCAKFIKSHNVAPKEHHNTCCKLSKPYSVVFEALLSLEIIARTVNLLLHKPQTRRRRLIHIGPGPFLYNSQYNSNSDRERNIYNLHINSSFTMSGGRIFHCLGEVTI